MRDVIFYVGHYSIKFDLAPLALIALLYLSAALISAATRSLPRRCATSAAICLTGDAIAQHSFEHKTLRKHDFIRSAHLGIYGGLSESEKEEKDGIRFRTFI